MLEKLRKSLSKDVCFEFVYYPRRDEVVARISLEKGLSSKDFRLIEQEMRHLGFEDFWIDSGECDLIEDRYTPPEIEFRSKADRVSEQLLDELKRRGRIILCGQRF